MGLFLKPEWDDFASKCVPVPAGTRQYEDMRTAFYAGVVAFLVRLDEASKTETTTECEEFFQTVTEELSAFEDEIRLKARLHTTQEGK